MLMLMEVTGNIVVPEIILSDMTIFPFSDCVYLWPPCVADADIIFLSCGFLSIFFPRLFSAIADWMSAILPHMMWP